MRNLSQSELPSTWHLSGTQFPRPIDTKPHPQLGPGQANSFEIYDTILVKNAVDELQQEGADEAGVGPQDIAGYGQEYADGSQRRVEGRGHDRSRSGPADIRLGTHG